MEESAHATGVMFFDHDFANDTHRLWLDSTTATMDAPHTNRTRSGRLSIDAVSRVKAFLERHLDERITLNDIAGVACVSRFHFARMFRRTLGESPMAYVLALRIERAKLRLIQGNESIAAIAAELGFCDQSHFTRTFRRLVGISPSQFARKHAASPAAPFTSRMAGQGAP